MTEEKTDLHAYVSVLRRRKNYFLLPMLAILLMGAGVAFLLPPIYRSTATILIEQQEVPEALVPSTETSYVTQRIQLISRRVMTAATLRAIVEKFDLYKNQGSTLQAIVERFGTITERFNNEIVDTIVGRLETYVNAGPVLSTAELTALFVRDVQLDMVTTEVLDRRSRSRSELTYAFTLSYENRSPLVAQQVVSELASLYLKENSRTRTEAVTETKLLLTQEAGRVSSRIRELESRLATFKEDHSGSLPKEAELTLRLRADAMAQIKDAQREIRSLEERQIFLESELAQLDPYITELTRDGSRVIAPEEQLRILQIEYASKAAVYSANHPDLVALRKEIAALRSQVGGGDESAALAAELAQLQSELGLARERYSSEHPDVLKLQRAMASIEERLRIATVTQSVAQLPASRPTNPAYVELRARLAAAKSDLRSLRQTQSELRGQLASYGEMLSKAPQVEREFSDLQRERNAALQEYAEIKKKQSAADLAAAVQERQKGERFSMLEPASEAIQVKPKRRAILFFSLVLSVAGGLGTATIAERLDQTIRSPGTVADILGNPPLALIPYIRKS